LQNADDSILKAMNRPYDSGFYRRLIERLVEEREDVAIGCDVIVGFPGEDREIFRRNYDYIAALPVAYLHVFRFSPRQGTPAASYSGQVDGEEKKARARELRELSREKFYRFRQGQMGKVRQALVLDKPCTLNVEEQSSHSAGGSPETVSCGYPAEGRWALTDNYIHLALSCGAEDAGRLLPVRIIRVTREETLAVPARQ